MTHRAIIAWLRLLILTSLLAISSLALASPRVLVVTQALEGAHAETLAALRHALSISLPAAEIDVRLVAETSLQQAQAASIIVTIGSEAATIASAFPAPTPILFTLLPTSALPAPKAHESALTAAIVLDQPASRLIALLRLALPKMRIVAIIAGPDSKYTIERLRHAAQSAGFKVRQAYIDNSDALFPALQHVLADPAVLIATPDAAVFNRYTVQNILLTTFRRRSPVLGFSAAYVKAGALLGLYSTPTQIGEDAASAVLELLAGRPQPAISAPRRFEVGVNQTVARALGIELPSAQTLMRDLRREEGIAP